MRFLIKSVAEGEPPSAMTKTVLIRIPLRLGGDAFRRASHDVQEKQLMRTVKAFRLLMKVYGVTAYRACATSAMRDASNGERIARKIHNKTGIRLESIDGQQEARIVYDSHVADLLDREGTYLYVDVGGGSTEISLIADGQLVDSHSFDIGTVRQLTGTVRPDDWQALDRELKVWAGRYGNLQIIGSGGNINKLYRLARASHDNRLEIGQLRALYDELKDKTVEQRMEQYSLNGDRADVSFRCRDFPADRVRDRRAPIIVPTIGIIDGIVHSLYVRHLERRRRTCNTGRKERASGFPPAYLRRGRYLGGAIGFRGFPVRCGRQSFAGLRSRIPARRDFRTSFVGLPSCLRSA
ncbi:MAG: Ppx/GppA family phosphatase [Alistipes ihumii]